MFGGTESASLIIRTEYYLERLLLGQGKGYVTFVYRRRKQIHFFHSEYIVYVTNVSLFLKC